MVPRAGSDHGASSLPPVSRTRGGAGDAGRARVVVGAASCRRSPARACDRTATDLVSALLKSGYLASDTPYGKLRFAVPRHALRFYFPNLWPEAERDPEMLEPAAARRVLQKSNSAGR